MREKNLNKIIKFASKNCMFNTFHLIIYISSRYFVVIIAVGIQLRHSFAFSCFFYVFVTLSAARFNRNIFFSRFSLIFFGFYEFMFLTLNINSLTTFCSYFSFSFVKKKKNEKNRKKVCPAYVIVISGVFFFFFFFFFFLFASFLLCSLWPDNRNSFGNKSYTKTKMQYMP